MSLDSTSTTSRPGLRVFGSTPNENWLTRRIVRLCFVVYWLLIFEGVLRKWVFPQASSLLFFVRDPFLLYIYWLALRGRIPRDWHVLAVGGVVAVAFCYLAGIQLLLGQSNILVAGYGIHNYFLYFPLAWVIYTYFDRGDIERLTRQTLLLSIPIAGLVAAQFFSPPDSWINKGTDETGIGVFEVVSGVVRPYGTFTFVLGQALFLGSLVAMSLGNLVAAPARKVLRGPLQLISGSSTISMILLSGSRTAFFLAGLMFLFALLSGFFSGQRENRIRTLVAPLAVATCAVGLFPMVFPSAFDAMVERQNAAVAVEGSTEARAGKILTSFVSVLNDVPALGYGIGVGTTGGAMLLTGHADFLLAEDEFSRIVQECGPAFGIIYILFRVALAIYLIQPAVTAARVRGDVSAFCLAGFSIVLLITAQATFEGTAEGYTWFFLGLALAATRPTPAEE